MPDPVRPEPAATPAEAAPVVVKKYANRRLYNTESSSYITLENLAEMVRKGRDFVVFDAKSGEDITRGVLTQIIVEEENKGRAMLPTGFLRQLIGFYGDSLQTLVPRYLEQSLETFSRQQEQMRVAMQQTIGPFLPFGPGIEEVSRQNKAMMERALSLFSPFLMAPGNGQVPPGTGPLATGPLATGPLGTAPAGGSPADGAPVAIAPMAGVPSAGMPPAGPSEADLAALHNEIETLRGQLAQARLAATAQPQNGSASVAPPAPPSMAAEPARRLPDARKAGG